MLEGEEGLTLGALNRATQAWVEREYHRSRHSEIGTTPLAQQKTPRTLAVELEKICFSLIGANPQGWVR